MTSDNQVAAAVAAAGAAAATAAEEAAERGQKDPHVYRNCVSCFTAFWLFVLKGVLSFLRPV